MKNLIVLLLTMMSTIARAEPVLGNLRGNGGFLVFCKDSPVRVLDFYEAQVNLGLKIHPFEPLVGSEFTKVRVFLQKMADYDPDLAQALLRWLSTFDTEIEWGSFAEKNLTHDTGNYARSKGMQGCFLQQAVIQWDSPKHRPQRARYQIDEKLWHHLETDQRAVLILHELIYRHILQYHTYSVNSTGVRSFVSGTLLAMQSDQPPTIFEYQLAKQVFLLSPL